MNEPDQLDMFQCGPDDIDESAGLKDDPAVYQLTELPGETFEEIFGGDAA